MQSRYNRIGMTLIELMAVIGIIALLAGLMAYYVISNRESDAQYQLSNDISSLLQAQRTRASSMNVATYVRVSNAAIEPRIGSTSACMTDIAKQYPILYVDVSAGGAYAVNNFVGIDVIQNAAIGGDFGRKLDSSQSNDYIGKDGTALANLSISSKTGNIVSTTFNSIVICFQPNGQAYFIDNAGNFISDERILFKIGAGDRSAVSITGHFFVVDLSSLGTIRSYSE